MPNQEVATSGAFSFGDKEAMPAHLSKGSGLGNENVDSDSLIMPKMNLLQALSPQISSVEGAKAGMLHNSLTDALCKECFVVNLKFDKQYSVFKKRTLGGGYNGNYGTEAEADAHVATLPGDKGDYDVQLTHIHTCLLLDEEGTPVQPVLIYFSNTKIAVSEKWNTDVMIRCKDSDRFGAVYKLGSREDKNGRGQTYHNFTVDFAGWPSEALFEEAKANYLSLAAKDKAEAASKVQ